MFTNRAVFWRARREVKIQRTSTNIQPYYTLKCLINYLLSKRFDSGFGKYLYSLFGRCYALFGPLKEVVYTVIASNTTLLSKLRILLCKDLSKCLRDRVLACFSLLMFICIDRLHVMS